MAEPPITVDYILEELRQELARQRHRNAKVGRSDVERRHIQDVLEQIQAKVNRLAERAGCSSPP
jgi:hypothetical protein